MLESKHERIIVALQELLQGIVADGTDYFYTPDKVVRAPAFSAACLDSSLDTIYVLSPEDVSDDRRDSCTYRSLLRVDLTAVTKHEPPTENPLDEPEPPLRWTVQTRLEHDAKHCIIGDSTVLGGLALQVDIPLTVYSPDTYWKGWAGVFMRLLIRYQYEKADGP